MDTRAESILAAIRASYVNLEDPSFTAVNEALASPAYRLVVGDLVAKGIVVKDDTDRNDDVAQMLYLFYTDETVWLALSGVGRFAFLISGSPPDQVWVTAEGRATSSLIISVVEIVTKAGFLLLDRKDVLTKVPFNHWDGSSEITVFQALFTDSDVIP